MAEVEETWKQCAHLSLIIKNNKLEMFMSWFSILKLRDAEYSNWLDHGSLLFLMLFLAMPSRKIGRE